jgi:hypothetical protein
MLFGFTAYCLFLYSEHAWYKQAKVEPEVEAVAEEQTGFAAMFDDPFNLAYIDVSYKGFGLESGNRSVTIKNADVIEGDMPIAIGEVEGFWGTYRIGVEAHSTYTLKPREGTLYTRDDLRDGITLIPTTYITEFDASNHNTSSANYTVETKDVAEMRFSTDGSAEVISDTVQKIELTFDVDMYKEKVYCAFDKLKIEATGKNLKLTISGGREFDPYTGFMFESDGDIKVTGIKRYVEDIYVYKDFSTVFEFKVPREESGSTMLIDSGHILLRGEKVGKYPMEVALYYKEGDAYSKCGNRYISYGDMLTDLPTSVKGKEVLGWYYDPILKEEIDLQSPIKKTMWICAKIE